MLKFVSVFLNYCNSKKKILVLLGKFSYSYSFSKLSLLFQVISGVRLWDSFLHWCPTLYPHSGENTDKLTCEKIREETMLFRCWEYWVVRCSPTIIEEHLMHKLTETWMLKSEKINLLLFHVRIWGSHWFGCNITG